MHTDIDCAVPQICALSVLRELGILHRDIKPGNILIDTSGRAVLTDFGMAQAVPTKSYETWRQKRVFGTFAYMAPEIVKGVEYGTTIDVWSLGLVFLEILGCVPFRYFTSDDYRGIKREHKNRLPIQYHVPVGLDHTFKTIVSSVSDVPV